MALETKHKVIGVVVIAVIVMIIALVASSLKRLESSEIGLAYDTVAKELATNVQGEGLHTGPPGYEFIVFPSIFTTLQFEDIKCLNKDGVPIELDISYQYMAQRNSLREIILQFKDHAGYEKVLKFAGESAVHETCSYYNTSQFQADRGAFQEELRAQLKSRYTLLKAEITDLQVNNIQRPAEYETAVRSKETAKENIKVAENERPRLITKAKTKLKEAQTQATITLEKASSDARITTTKGTAEAEAILDRYSQEAASYARLIASSGLNLSTEGFLSYIGVRAISAAKNPVYVGLKGPAKTSYVP